MGLINSYDFLVDENYEAVAIVYSNDKKNGIVISDHMIHTEIVKVDSSGVQAIVDGNSGFTSIFRDPSESSDLLPQYVLQNDYIGYINSNYILFPSKEDTKRFVRYYNNVNKIANGFKLGEFWKLSEESIENIAGLF